MILFVFFIAGNCPSAALPFTMRRVSSNDMLWKVLTVGQVQCALTELDCVETTEGSRRAEKLCLRLLADHANPSAKTVL